MKKAPSKTDRKRKIPSRSRHIAFPADLYDFLMEDAASEFRKFPEAIIKICTEYRAKKVAHG